MAWRLIFSFALLYSPLAFATPFLHSRGIATNNELRILPLGDSITWGFQSSDGNGYRQNLLNMLSGNTVQYVGSQRSGNMANNLNEGHPGAVINEIAGYAHASLPSRPNIVLLMAGTNDCNRPEDPGSASTRLGSLIDEVVTACPDAAVIVAQIPPIADGSKEAFVGPFNAALPGVVAQRANAGNHVLLVDMHSALTTGDLIDGLHPTDHGYDLMAQVWFGGLQQAAAKGWISAPVEVATHQGHGAACAGALFWYNSYGQIASGVGQSDKSFQSGWLPAGTLASGVTAGANVRIADINGDGKDDYIIVDPQSGALEAYINGGYSGSGVNWLPWGKIATGIGEGAGVVLADITGDGLADYLWISQSGSVTGYKNGGPGSGGAGAGTWVWTPLGDITGGLSSDRDSIRFADIDGDGRADFHMIGDAGDVTTYLNSGPDDKPQWVPLGKIATGIPGSDKQGVHLIDLNADGRADWVWLDHDGKATSYINYRGDGNGLAPNWQSAGVIATGVGTARDNITFGDINGDGKSDYIFVHADSGAIEAWMNTGSGGAFQAGELVVFGDLNGDGLDDYMSIDSNGAVLAYQNQGWNDAAKTWIWVPWGTIASGVGARKSIRMADFDGDGKVDYAVVDDKTGATTLWLNGGPSSAAPNGWLWYPKGQIATGIGAGAGVHFADLNNDGRADYLYLTEGGAVTAYINGGENSQAQGGWLWISYGTIATGVGANRADVRFADLNGDGQADYIWVDRLSGAVNAWYNGGGQPGNWIWYPQGRIATGVSNNGLSIHFGDMLGTGRDDYLIVNAASAAVTVWTNGCDTEPGATSPGANHNFGNGAGNADWQQVECTSDGVNDASKPQDYRWQTVHAESAWTAVIKDWKLKSSVGTSLSFIESVSNFFNGPESMACDKIDDGNNCKQTLVCNSVNAPAGYMILNSMIVVSELFNNIDTTMISVQANVTTIAGSFSSAVATVDDGAKFLGILLDFLSLGYTAAITPFWAKMLHNTPFFKTHPAAGDILKDEVNGLVTNVLQISKDLSDDEPKVDNESKLKDAVSAMLGSWKQATSSYLGFLFSGTDEGIDALHKIITDGKMMEVGTSIVGRRDLENSVGRAIFARLIPAAWQLAAPTTHPVIISTGHQCGDKVDPIPADVDSETGAKSYGCVDGQLYYLVSATNRESDCTGSTTGFGSHCVDQQFSPLPGYQTIDGKTWYGVSMSDLIVAGVNTFKANGNKNGGPAPDPKSSDSFNAIFDQDILAPGIIAYPVCSSAEARDNWKHGRLGKNFPCNS